MYNQKEYMKGYYKRTRQKQLARAKVRQTQGRAFIQRMKCKPCADCGIQYNPWVMDFDHIDPQQKEFGIGECSQYTLQRLEKEIGKCEVVCSNCHRERTHHRRNPFKTPVQTKTGQV